MRTVTIILLAASIGCVHHPTRPQATTTADTVVARYVTRTPPPEAYTETPPPQPKPTYVWAPGWFKWDGRSFEWVVGRWLPPPPGTHEWVPGVWSERKDGQWQFVDGHWQ
jgi:WXXGXW repeat (2 copies)